MKIKNKFHENIYLVIQLTTFILNISHNSLISYTGMNIPYNTHQR